MWYTSFYGYQPYRITEKSKTFWNYINVYYKMLRDMLQSSFDLTYFLLQQYVQS